MILMQRLVKVDGKVGVSVAGRQPPILSCTQVTLGAAGRFQEQAAGSSAVLPLHIISFCFWLVNEGQSGGVAAAEQLAARAAVVAAAAGYGLQFSVFLALFSQGRWP